MILSSAGLGVHADLQLHALVHTAAYMPPGTSVALTAFASKIKLLRAVKKGAGCKELQKDLRDWMTRQPKDELSLTWINVK